MKKIKNNNLIILKRVLFIVIILGGNIFYSQSQVSFRQLSVKDGLSQNSVVSVSKDSIGYLWIATQDGSNKYDGNKIESVHKTNPKETSSIPNKVQISSFQNNISQIKWIAKYF